jgi:two-component system NtrC family sensor kinase
MKARIARRVMVAVGVVSLASFGASAWLASRAHERELASLVERQALILSDTIRNSTRHAMLLNEREMVHRIIEQIGRQGGLEKVRVYNKEGEVIYSPDADARRHHVSTSRARPATAATAAGGSVAELSAGQADPRLPRRQPTSRHLGVITPIRQRAGLFANGGLPRASRREQRVLGVLDLTVSLADVDRAVVQASRRSALAAGASRVVAAISVLLIASLFHRLGRHARCGRCSAGPKSIAAGDLAPSRRRSSGADELGQLAEFVQPDEREASPRRASMVYQSNKLASVGRLAAGIAHEINNPLTGVLTYSSFLLKRATDEETRRATSRPSCTRPSAAATSCADLLDFSRQVPPKKTQVDLNAIVERALAIVDNQLKVQNIQLTKSLAKNLPAFPADANQLQQVVLNLLVNAADAFELGDRQIYVATDVKEVAGRAMAEIKVADNGTGIPEKNLGRIFEPFFTTKENRGTGLGLSVCWGIVTEHGGTIEVDSKVGRGTTFTVRMPLAPPPAPAPGPTPSAATLPPAERPS